MDIEGSEYYILDHLFNSEALSYISSIYYEDHCEGIALTEWQNLRQEVISKYFTAFPHILDGDFLHGWDGQSTGNLTWKKKQ